MLGFVEPDYDEVFEQEDDCSVAEEDLDRMKSWAGYYLLQDFVHRLLEHRMLERGGDWVDHSLQSHSSWTYFDWEYSAEKENQTVR